MEYKAITKKQLAVALGAGVIGIEMVVTGFYQSQLKSNPTSTGPIKYEVSSTSSSSSGLVMDNPVIIPAKELGPPSKGTTHINQRLIAESDNPYSMTDAESVGNFNASTEGRFLQTLFKKLNSPADTIVNQQIANISDADLSRAIRISPTFQRMLYGYRTSDDVQYFLYDANLMHQFQPHTAFLHYVQTIRPDSTYQAQMRGAILPKVTNDIPTKVKMKFGNRSVDYLVRQSAGTCLIESIGSEVKHFEVSFQFNLGIPHDVEPEGYPLLVWPSGLEITIKPIDPQTWAADKQAFFVKG